MAASITFAAEAASPENVPNVLECVREATMKAPHRRQFLQLAAGAAALPAVSWTANAQTWPARPVRLIVGFGAGSTADILARLMSQWLSERLGQQFVVENRTGAGGNIATEAVVRSPADGYTLLLAGSNDAINTKLYDKLSYNFIRDIEPIAALTRSPNVMVVNPSVPATTVPEFIAYAKANPGKINMASVGIGTVPHVAGELFNIMAGVNLVHVPYRGAPAAFSDLIGGQVQVYFPPIDGSIEHIRAGKLRALAVAAVKRSEVLPDVPTVGEFLPGFEASVFLGIGAPKNTPTAIVERLSKEINAALADPNVKARYADLGTIVLGGSPADFGKLIAEDAEKWGKVIRVANIKAV
jgi:tripartite-type tricarboxylate transporter receptor subunit TctC